MDDSVLSICLRYALILIMGLGNLFIFYAILTPLTLYGAFFIITLFSQGLMHGNSIYLADKIIELVPSCVAGSAYYLLFILIFSTPKIKPKNRLKILLFSFSILYIINITRIALFAFISVSLFDTFHIIFWYIISTLLVVAIWLASIKIFNIKSIPIYTDLKFLHSLTKKPKKPKRKK